jgi:MOSC domain-containing protein YiiM
VPQIVSIAYKPAHIEQRPADYYARAAIDPAVLVVDHGIEGDSKGRAGRRQLNIMRKEMVDQLRAEGLATAPGQLGEQIVIAGLESDELADGARLRLGSTAVIEVASIRTPCGRFAHIQGRPQESVAGRIGVMARVMRGGTIAVGDEVWVETKPGVRGQGSEVREEG